MISGEIYKPLSKDDEIPVFFIYIIDVDSINFNHFDPNNKSIV